MYDETGSVGWPPALDGTKVVLQDTDTLHANHNSGPYRTSPIFPLTETFKIPQFEGAQIHVWFACFDPAFCVMGRLGTNAPPELASQLLFSAGLASVILIGQSPSLYNELLAVARSTPHAVEHWVVENSFIKVVECSCSSPRAIEVPSLPDYESLPIIAKTALDEFVSGMGILLPKVTAHLPSEFPMFHDLVERVRELALEMVYVSNPVGEPVETLSEFSQAELAAGLQSKHDVLFQNTDRIVQINAALSYLSTQALSGAVPILERRSLIRRHSLLGVGTAVLALLRMTRAIERAFAAANLEEVIKKAATNAKPLPGLDDLPSYDASNWHKHSVNRWKGVPPAANLIRNCHILARDLGFEKVNTRFLLHSKLSLLVPVQTGAC